MKIDLDDAPDMEIYPYCPVITRTIEVGGLKKWQLIQKLQQHSISMNEYGERLLSDDKFTTSETKYSLETVELTVRDLGFLVLTGRIVDLKIKY